MRRSLAPLLFEDHDRQAARARRRSPVEKARVSDAALAKAGSKMTADGLEVRCFLSLIADLSTLCVGEYSLPGSSTSVWSTCQSTPLQERAFELLDADPGSGVYSTMTA